MQSAASRSRTWAWLCQRSLPGSVVAGSTDPGQPACVGNVTSLLLHAGNAPVNQLSCRAKKADAFFKIALSSRKRRTSASSARIRYCSALYWAIQRRTAVSPMSSVQIPADLADAQALFLDHLYDLELELHVECSALP
ncbi:hypothetical protein LH449_12485, partial [Laribacter hongkongensis]